MKLHIKLKSLFQCPFVFLLVFFLIATVFPAAVKAEVVPPDPTETDTREEPVYREQTLVITKARFTSDSFNGVPTLYRPGRGDGSNATYSCAAYVKRYYKKIYGLTINNMYSGRVPNVVGGGDSFLTVTSPAPGDIAAAPGHWAIVKAVNADGTVTLIEQNWKWQQGGKTVTKINRRVKNEQLRFLRLKSVQALFEIEGHETDVQKEDEGNNPAENSEVLPAPEVVIVVQEP